VEEWDAIVDIRNILPNIDMKDLLMLTPVP